jgi:hypothetical protein
LAGALILAGWVLSWRDFFLRPDVQARMASFLAPLGSVSIPYLPGRVRDGGSPPAPDKELLLKMYPMHADHKSGE